MVFPTSDVVSGVFGDKARFGACAICSCALHTPRTSRCCRKNCVFLFYGNERCAEAVFLERGVLRGA